jgi:GDSL-like Lipase/Acylhydrolase family
MSRIRMQVFAVCAGLLGAISALVVCAAVYVFGIKHFHYAAVPPIMRLPFVRAYLFDWRFRRLVELMEEDDAQNHDVFSTVWDTSEGTLLSRKMFHPVDMYGAQKYMYNPGLRKLSFALDVDGFSRSFSMVDSPSIRLALRDLDPFHFYTATYDQFGFRRVDSELTAQCSVRVMFLGDSFTDGAYMNDDETVVNRYGHLVRERAGISACPIDTGVDGYGSLEESFVLEHYFDVVGQPRVVIVMHFPNDVDVDANKVIDARMANGPRQWADDLAYLSRIAEFGRRHDTTIVLAAIPLARQSKDPSTRKNYQDVLRGFCETEGIRFIDLLNGLEPLDSREIYLEGDPHWTPKGHQAVAGILYEQTKDLLASSVMAAARTR